MTIVAGAVAGDDLERVASTVAYALGCPVAIALPALAQPVLWPPDTVEPGLTEQILASATAAIAGETAAIGGETAAGDTVALGGAAAATASAITAQAMVRIGHETVGIVVALGTPVTTPVECRAWLDAAAAAAAVTALMREANNGGGEASRRAFLQALCAGRPADVDAFVAHARRLGFELGAGATALCARGGSEIELPPSDEALLADLGGGRILGLVPLDRDAAADARLLRRAGLEVALSAPRRDPGALHDALREAELLVELGSSPDGQEETFRLLIGVLLRDPEELESLRHTTISALQDYDARHHTELLATLQSFFAHHGSTTETAEAMDLHRHTVGYRLSRVHEVSGLSPYESEGRERLSLGLKADQILEAHQRLSK